MAVTAFTLAALLAACGSSSKSTNSDTSSTSAPSGSTAPAAGSEAAKIAAGAITEPNAADVIPVTAKLTSKPAAKTIAWLQCTLPVCQPYRKGFEDATKALGWNLKTIDVDLTNPAPAFQQALDSKPDFIAMLSTPVAQIEEQFKAAKTAGIPVLECAGNDVPTGKAGNGLYMDCGDVSSIGPILQDLVAWSVADAEKIAEGNDWRAGANRKRAARVSALRLRPI